MEDTNLTIDTLRGNIKECDYSIQSYGSLIGSAKELKLRTQDFLSHELRQIYESAGFKRDAQVKHVLGGEGKIEAMVFNHNNNSMDLIVNWRSGRPDDIPNDKPHGIKDYTRPIGEFTII